MKLLVVFSIFVHCAQAFGSLPYRLLLEGGASKFAEAAFETLTTSPSIEEKRAVLRAVLSYQSRFFEAKEFAARVLDYGGENCVASGLPCASLGAWQFGLEALLAAPVLSMRHGKNSLNYPARSRTGLDHPLLQFGRALHIIYKTNSPGTVFVLIREIESAREQQAPLRQTLNVFRLTEKESCKVAEADVTGLDDTYELTVAFIHAFGNRADCKAQPASF